MCKIEKVHFNSSEKSKVKIRHTCENQVKPFPHEKKQHEKSYR